MLRCRAFVGALGRRAGSPPPIHLDGVDFKSAGAPGAWILYAASPGADNAPGGGEPGFDAPITLSSGRPHAPADLQIASPPDRALARIDGRFSWARLSPSRCEVATDCLGAGGLYYRILDDTIYFADQLGLLLQVVRGPIRPNKLAIAALCVGQLQLTAETHVSGIYRLAAGQVLTAERDAATDALTVRTATYLSALEALTSGPPIRDVETFDALLGQSIERERYGPRTALMLSGGRDSRALALAGHGVRFEAVSYGDKLSTDVMWARRFARSAKLPHHLVPYGSWGLDTFANVIVGLGGGGQGLQIANNLVGYHWARDRFDLGIVGYLGDAMTGSHVGLDPDTPERRFTDLLIGRLRPYDCDLGAVFAAEIDELRSEIRSRSAACGDLPRHQVHRLLDFTIRQSTWIGGMFSLCAWYLPLSYPFFYRPLLAGMFQADFKLLAGQSLYDRWLGWKQRSLGIDFRKSPAPERVLSWRTRLTKGMWPPTRVYWPDVFARSRPWVDQQPDCGIDYLDRVTRESMSAMRPDSNEDDPVLCMTMPLQQIFRRWGRASA